MGGDPLVADFHFDFRARLGKGFVEVAHRNRFFERGGKRAGGDFARFAIFVEDFGTFAGNPLPSSSNPTRRYFT